MNDDLSESEYIEKRYRHLRRCAESSHDPDVQAALDDATKAVDTYRKAMSDCVKEAKDAEDALSRLEKVLREKGLYAPPMSNQ